MYKKEKTTSEKKSFGFQKQEHKKKDFGKKQKVFFASTPKKKLQKRDRENELVGIYKQLQGFGFVDIMDEVTGEKKGYFVHESKKLDAFEGDEVAFEVQSFRGREEATIKKVLKRSEHLIVGTLRMGKTFAFVIPKTSHIKSDIFIPGKFIGGYTDGAQVAVQIIKWEGKNPEGRIIEALADLPAGREDIYKIAFEMGARRSFSEKIKEEVAKLQSPEKRPVSYETGLRKDLRKLLTYTIDGAESKDLDDAISILPISGDAHTKPHHNSSPQGEEKEFLRSDTRRVQEGGGGIVGYRLFVHIADVSHFVREDGELDREARKRGTSIYLVDQVIPMLPAELSNGLCSLHPGEDKLTLTCEMEINLQGKVTHAKVYESVILSDYRLTYREIDEIVKGKNLTQDTSIQLSPARGKSELQDVVSPLLAGEDRERCLEEKGLDGVLVGDPLQFGGKLTPELQKNIFLLKELTDILGKNTRKRGALDFDFPETKIILDEAGKPIEYKKYERYDSYKIIEECMVLANESVAKLYCKYPFLYRIHEKPDNEDIEKFMKIIETVTPPTASQLSPSSNGMKDAALLSSFEEGGVRRTEGAMLVGNYPKSFQSLLETLKASPKLEPFQRLLLRSLAKARYSEKNMGHFGLALDFYSHFTSPIRRYPDLQIHRIMKEILLKNYSPERKSHYTEILPKVARRSSETSDRAEKMEYKVRDMLACKYMSDKIGEIFTGKIGGMIEKGFFVELPNTIEGFIEFGFSGYSFNIENYTITQQKTGATLQFGDEVSVKVRGVDMEKYRIEFELV